jgi:hypothetical protein
MSELSLGTWPVEEPSKFHSGKHERELAAGKDIGESLGFRANATGGVNLDVLGHSTALLVEGHVHEVSS